MTKYFLHALLVLNFLVSTALAGQSVAIRLTFEAPTLDWNLGDVPIHVINNVMEGLYALDAKGRVKPVQAEGLPRKKSKNTFLIRLRANLKWSDGQPVKAADYVYSWERLRNPKTASTYPYLVSEIESARAVGDREIEIKVKKKAGALRIANFTHWATFAVRADLVEKYGSRWANAENMVFNGRYKIADYREGERFLLVPNTQHARPGKFEKIEALIVTDDQTALRLYDAGRLDFMSDLGSLDRKQFERRPDYRSMRSPVLVYVGATVSANLVTDPKIRKTLSKTIDRAALVKALGGTHAVATGILPARPVEVSAVTPMPFLESKFLSFAYFEKGSNRTLVEFLQAQWKDKLKLTVDLFPAEVKTYWTKLAKNPLPLFLNSFGPPVWDDYYYFNLLRSNNPMNMGRWSNKAYDRALDSGDRKTLQRILDEEQPVIPLYFRSYEYLVSSKLKGASSLNPMTSLYID